MAKVVRSHPRFRDVDLIIVVPSTRSGVSETLGKAVAANLRKPFIIAKETTGSKEQDKSGAGTTEKVYSVGEEAKSKSVLVLDDVYWSGRALRGVALAARNAGASSVVGLVSARNLRA
jgi:adenine/guanine phosphoribosyltransferase-like PRPP-binding protein